MVLYSIIFLFSPVDKLIISYSYPFQVVDLKILSISSLLKWKNTPSSAVDEVTDNTENFEFIPVQGAMLKGINIQSTEDPSS